MYQKASQLQDALQLLNEADLLRYRVGECEPGKNVEEVFISTPFFSIIEEQENDRKKQHPLFLFTSIPQISP
ncbi:MULTISPECIES: hypothetical protein [unclassified Streptococcus]|uniref:Uncharacterized protein n=1 Tax=Streptococcus parapneumoniae TaxID=2993430 RepID=A0ABM8CE25_9STRE|nr:MULTISPECIES: hypothetical protein [unclassified Streptococcus]BDT63686.1 hypothetical protein SP4011_01030 [Streptococcus sp. SP4011]